MALQETVTLTNNLVVQNAYIRIDTISGYKGGLTLSINKYISRDAFNTGASYLDPTEFYTFIPDTSRNAKEIFTQGYEHIKTAKYHEAVDVFEDETG